MVETDPNALPIAEALILLALALAVIVGITEFFAWSLQWEESEDE